MLESEKFEKILEEYAAKRTLAEKKASEKKDDIYFKLPKLDKIDKEIARLSMESAKARIRKNDLDFNLREKTDELLKIKRDLLHKNGFTEKDLEPVYDCPTCKDTGFTETGYCSCLKTKIVDSLYDQMPTKELLKKENFKTYSFEYYSNEIPKGENLSPLTTAKKVVSSAREFIANFETSSENLLINGPTGVGKTFLCNSITKELLDKGHFIIYLTAGKFFELLGDSTFNKNLSNGDFVSENIFKCDLLLIDDLGTELMTRFVESMLFEVVNERILQGKHTVISTNLSLDQIGERYGDRIFSRFCGSYTLLSLIGDDIRIKKGLGK